MNALGPEGCRRKLEFFTGRLFETATKTQWLIEPEQGVAPEDIGQPVPQTVRTRLARLVARYASVIPAGESLIRSGCCALILSAIEAVEAESMKAEEIKLAETGKDGAKGHDRAMPGEGQGARGTAAGGTQRPSDCAGS